VCRGCKRFAHEIVQWNGYDDSQQAQVWRRLHDMRDAVVEHYLHITDPALFAAACEQARIEGETRAAAVYGLLSWLVARQGSLSGVGLGVREGAAEDTALPVLKTIDAEMYARSMAHYERNFKIPL